MTGVRIITEAPNIENTIPASLYQASSPEKFSLEEDDKFVLYGGGTNYHINILNNDPTHELRIDPQVAQIQHSSTASLFVLNTSFIIWLEQLHRGLDIGYPSIILHALQQLDNQPALYLQLVSNDVVASIPNGPSEFTSSVEVVITAVGDPQENPLFSHQRASTLEEIYHAMSQCSSFHVDSDDSDSDLDLGAPSVPGHWLEQGRANDDGHWIQNSGHADDLQMDDGDSEGPESGMNVDVGFAQIVGNIRRRDDEDHEVELAKARRLQ